MKFIIARPHGFCMMEQSGKAAPAPAYGKLSYFEDFVFLLKGYAMSRKTIATEKAPAAIGPYVQAVEANGFVFCSGQLPIDPQTGKLADSSITDSTEQVLRNIKAVLEAAGLTLAHVVKATVFLKNLDDFAAMNEVYTKHFPQNPPARSTIEISRLPKGALVEIEVVAAR